MMAKGIGISCYPGLEHSESMLRLIGSAAKRGVKHVFISLHIPETDFKEVFAESKKLCKEARANEMSITADVSPRTLSFLGLKELDLGPFAELGLTDVRMDFGFSIDDIVAASSSYQLGIVLNASDVSNEWTKSLITQMKGAHRIWACHNFYPRCDSGLAWEYFLRRSKELKELGLEIAAFVPSQMGRRPIMYEGLPTLERHRWMQPGQAARELFATKVIDYVYFGDSQPSDPELNEVLRAAQEECLEIRVALSRPLTAIEEKLAFEKVHVQPLGGAYAHVIRSAAGRSHGELPMVYPLAASPRPKGTVTIDNINYGRYCGELQITLEDLGADPRVNVIGRIVPEDIHLIDMARSGAAFRLKVAEN